MSPNKPSKGDSWELGNSNLHGGGRGKSASILDQTAISIANLLFLHPCALHSPHQSEAHSIPEDAVPWTQRLTSVRGKYMERSVCHPVLFKKWLVTQGLQQLVFTCWMTVSTALLPHLNVCPSKDSSCPVTDGGRDVEAHLSCPKAEQFWRSL